MESGIRVFFIQKERGCSSRKTKSMPLSSPSAVLYALEVNQGFFEERGVKVGDHADLPG